MRDGSLRPPADSVLAQIAATDLAAPVAAVELLNVLRPTVAVAWPGTFAALALARHPQWRSRVADDAADHEQARRAFGHEVRRTAPFVPALAGRMRADAVVGGVRLRPGDRIVLDVPGTDKDTGSWDAPEEFRPDRFAAGYPDPFTFVPQGGGDPATGHRCPGEPLTVRLLAETLGALAATDYEVVSPATTDLGRIPTLPARGLVIRV